MSGRFQWTLFALAIIGSALVAGAISAGILRFWEWVFPNSAGRTLVGFLATFLLAMFGAALGADLRGKR